MKEKVILYIAFLLMINTSCSHKDKSLENNLAAKDTIFLDDNKKLKNIFELLDKAKEIKVIPLETNNSSIISRIDKIVSSNNLLYILDNKQKKIFCFNINGVCKFQIDRRGPGPEEYSDLNDIDIYSDKLYLLDRSGFKLLVYRLNGQFDRVIKFKNSTTDYNSLGILNNDNIVLVTNASYSLINTSSNKEFVHIFDMNGNLKKRMITKPESYNKRLSMFYNQNRIKRLNNKLYFELPFDNRIYQVKKDTCIASYMVNPLSCSNLDNFIENNKSLNDDEFLEKIVGDNIVVPSGDFIINNDYMIYNITIKGKPIVCQNNFASKTCEMFYISTFRLFTSGNNELLLMIDVQSFNSIRYSGIQGSSINKIRKAIDKLKLNNNDNPLIIQVKL